MLLRFSASNHLSIFQEQELSLVSSGLSDIEGGLLKVAGLGTRRALPFVVLYGENASGKSNLVNAIRYARFLILSSHSESEPEGGVPRAPFVLSEQGRSEPTTIHVDFVLDGIRCHYGFVVSDERVEEEWLFSFPIGKRQMLFERKGQDFNFGRNLRGQNHVISKLTRDNSLFVAAAAQNDHPMLTKIQSFFRKIEISGNQSPYSDSQSVVRAINRHGLDSRALAFLRAAGTGIVGYREIETELTEKDLAIERGVYSVLKRHIPTLVESEIERLRRSIELAHQGRDEEHAYLSINQESEGTRRLLALIGPILSALDEGKPVVVDELDASLHTQVCQMVLQLFADPKVNANGAQLIATTHDTNLLQSKVIRRDQIWFTEKNEFGETTLYPLSDFRTRKSDNLERGYLEQRYGASPQPKKPSEIIGAS